MLPYYVHVFFTIGAIRNRTKAAARNQTGILCQYAAPVARCGRTPCRATAFDLEIFAGMEWGTEKVFAATIARIREWGSTVAVLPERSDIDTAEDLERYGLLVGAEP